VIRAWRSNGIAWGTIRLYRRWVRRFREDCRQRGVVAEEQLKWEIVERWVAQCVRARETDPDITKRTVRSALWAWSWGLKACGYKIPPWVSAPLPTPTLSPLQDAFVRHRRDVRGLAESTIRQDLALVQEFLRFLRRQRRSIATIKVANIDRFLQESSRRMTAKTLARVVWVLRSFLRFLYASGLIPHNLATAVTAPRIRRGDTPPRALPWSDVRRILRAIDRTTRTGRRDYAMLLLMVTYGLGSGEVRGLTLESVDWRRRQLRVVRPKTSREICLPLLPGVAQALVAYLRNGRPRHCTARALFVQMHAPYGCLQSSSAIRHVLGKHALSAGVSATYLGSHVLRHSHASRQIDQGASATVVGDIMGHRRPESTSAYVRVALHRLRGMALPVPR
jgi:site-specific recombinase XerD